MRVRTAVAITTLVGTLGGLGIAVASGATPIWNGADLPGPSLTVECPSGLELGESGSVLGSLTDAATGDPIARRAVQVTRDDDFGAPELVGDDRTASDGSFGPLSDTPANRGNQTYEVTFAGTNDYASTTATCDAAVHGTDTTITTTEPTTVAPGQDLTVVGTLATAAGDPVPGATITATDTVDGQATDLTAATTDSEGGFTVTVPSISTGSHAVELSYAGDPVLEPATATRPVSVASAQGTLLTLDPPTHPLAGEDLVVEGTLANASGDPLAAAEITATDTVDGQTTDLTAATTDSEGGFTVTVPSAAVGKHGIDVAFAGGGGNQATTQHVDVDVKHETVLTLDGPDTLPDAPADVPITVTLEDGNGAPLANRAVVLDDGNELRTRITDDSGTATYKLFDVSDEVPVRVELTFAGNATYWNASTGRIWKADPQYTLTKDQRSYLAGQTASLAVTTPSHTLPTTITLKPYRRPAISITPSSDSAETLFTRQLYRNSTLTVSTEATDEYRAGSRTFTIRVAPRITQTLVGWYDMSGDTYLVRTTRDPRLDAKVMPARPGRCVKAVVQKYVDGAYQTVQTSACRLLDTESTASFKLVKNPRAGAKFRLRFESPADDMNIGGHGDWTALRFTR